LYSAFWILGRALSVGKSPVKDSATSAEISEFYGVLQVKSTELLTIVLLACKNNLAWSERLLLELGCPALSSHLIAREFISGNLKKCFEFGSNIIKVDGALRSFHLMHCYLVN
jgi:hypothetical protein